MRSSSEHSTLDGDILLVLGTDEGCALEFRPALIDDHVAENSKVLQTMQTLKVLQWRLRRTDAASESALAKCQDGKRSAELRGGAALWPRDVDETVQAEPTNVHPLMTPCGREALRDAAEQTEQRMEEWRAAREGNRLQLRHGQLTPSQRLRSLGMRDALHLYGGHLEATAAASTSAGQQIRARWTTLSWAEAAKIFGGGHVALDKTDKDEFDRLIREASKCPEVQQAWRERAQAKGDMLPSMQLALRMNGAEGERIGGIRAIYEAEASSPWHLGARLWVVGGMGRELHGAAWRHGVCEGVTGSSQGPHRNKGARDGGTKPCPYLWPCLSA